MPITAATLAPLDAALEALAPESTLAQIHRAFGARAAILCGMQLSGTVLCHLADRAGLAFDVLFVDTGVLHAETLATRDALAAACPRLRVITLRPAQTFAEQTRAHGLLYLSKEGQERCCDLRKSAPLAEVRGRYDVLLAGLARDEGGKRARLRAIELDVPNQVLRVHPLVKEPRAMLDDYVRRHPDVPVNPLHGMGFPSIGCFPCTTPVRPDEDARAGRWRHLADVSYCGINPTDRADAGGPALEDGPTLAAGLSRLAGALGLERAPDAVGG